MAPTISQEEQYKYLGRGIYAIRKNNNVPSIRSESVTSHIGKTKPLKRLNRIPIQRKSSISTSSSDDEDNITSSNSSIDLPESVNGVDDVNFDSSLSFCNVENCDGSCSDNSNDVNYKISRVRKSPVNEFEFQSNLAPISSASLISTLDGQHFQKSKLYKRQPQSTKGLFDVAIKTIQLIKRNELLHQRLTQLQVETKEFIESVMSNPENSGLKIKIENDECNSTN